MGTVGKVFYTDFQTQRLGYCWKEKLQILLSNKNQRFVIVEKVFYTDFQIQRFWNYGEKHNTILISKKDPGSGTVGKRQSYWFPKTTLGHGAKDKFLVISKDPGLYVEEYMLLKLY